MKRNWLRFNADNKSYFYPSTKIVICIILINICFFREDIIPITFNHIFDYICIAITCICLLCICISICELSQAYENRNNKQELSYKTIIHGYPISIEEIISIVESNEIVEIQIVFDNKVFPIGSSSDSKNGCSEFFDKLYYCGNKNYEKIDDFQAELQKYTNNGQINIVTIDGIRIKESNSFNNS